MRRYVWIVGIFAAIVAGGILLFNRPASAQTVPPTPFPGLRTQPDGSIQDNSVSPNALTSKLLSNPYCYQPDPSVNTCYINVRYYSASDNGTSAPYMLGVNISINGALRLRENLFFENNVYYSYDMAPGGLKVPCGTPNQGLAGSAYGLVYLVKVEPIDSGGVGMGYDQASLACPAYNP